MQQYMSINKAASRLKAKGCIHLIRLLFESKLISIGTTWYITKEQYQECRSKDFTQLPVK